MNIVADNQIPFLNEYFDQHGKLITKSGNAISHLDLADADLLLTRSVTFVNSELVKNSALKMVASATAGFDHVDLAALQQNTIAFYHAAGCNSNAVAEYVIACVARLQQQGKLATKGVAGVIGVGQVGSKVAKKLASLGYDILLNDPPRAKNEPNFHSEDLANFIDCDLICVHTPLIKNGEFPTHHLLDQKFLAALKPGAVVLNAGRGSVIDPTAIFQLKNILFCLDVYSHEPNIDYELIEHCHFATPHIAGYSLQAKLRATHMVYQACCEFFGWQPKNPRIDFPAQEILVTKNTSWRDVVLQVFDPEKFRVTKNQFTQNRADYPLRNEFQNCRIGNALTNSTDQAIIEQLGLIT